MTKMDEDNIFAVGSYGSYSWKTNNDIITFLFFIYICREHHLVNDHDSLCPYDFMGKYEMQSDVLPPIRINWNWCRRTELFYWCFDSSYCTGKMTHLS